MSPPQKCRETILGAINSFLVPPRFLSPSPRRSGSPRSPLPLLRPHNGGLLTAAWWSAPSLFSHHRGPRIDPKGPREEAELNQFLPKLFFGGLPLFINYLLRSQVCGSILRAKISLYFCEAKASFKPRCSTNFGKHRGGSVVPPLRTPEALTSSWPRFRFSKFYKSPLRASQLTSVRRLKSTAAAAESGCWLDPRQKSGSNNCK